MNIKNIALAATLALGSAATAVSAQVTLSAVSAFPEGHLFSSRFESLIEDFNAAHGDEVFIDYKGGAPAIGSPFTLGERVQRGQFDLLNIAGPYYETVVPVALALMLTDKPMSELRDSDWFAAMQEAHQARGLQYLGKTVHQAAFHLYLKKPIDKADLTGLRLRVAPHYQPFFGELGATTMRSNLAEIYTLVENGAIDGFGWPNVGFLPDWLEITPYRVDPGFYDADLNVVMNLESWEELNDEQRGWLADFVEQYEMSAPEVVSGWMEESYAKMDEAGMQVIELSPEESEKFLSMSKSTAWDTVISRDPEIGARLRSAASVD